MRKLSSFFACALFVVVAACGGSSDDGDDDDDSPDASVSLTPDANTATPDAAQSTNALGQVCDPATACPAGHECTGIQGVGDPNSGYCSPMCNGDTAVCTTGYTGPAGGSPMCVLGAQGQPPTLCAIICTAPAQCPSGLDCIEVPGQPQPVSVCAPPAP